MRRAWAGRRHTWFVSAGLLHSEGKIIPAGTLLFGSMQPCLTWTQLWYWMMLVVLVAVTIMIQITEIKGKFIISGISGPISGCSSHIIELICRRKNQPLERWFYKLQLQKLAKFLKNVTVITRTMETQHGVITKGHNTLA